MALAVGEYNRATHSGYVAWLSSLELYEVSGWCTAILTAAAGHWLEGPTPRLCENEGCHNLLAFDLAEWARFCSRRCIDHASRRHRPSLTVQENDPPAPATPNTSRACR